MDRVGIDGLSKVSANGASVGFLRIRCPHQLAIARDRTFTLSHLNNHWS